MSIQKVKVVIFSNSIFLMLSFFVLNTYYFYQVDLPIVQLIGIIFLVYAYKKYSINTHNMHRLLLLISILIILVSSIGVINIFITDNIASPVTLIGFVLCIIVFIFAYSIEIDNNKIYKIITMLTLILLVFWFIQYCGYYLFDYRIDYFIDLVGYKQRTNLGAFGQAFFRPASLFIEPAMYANAMLLLFYFRLLYKNLILDKVSILILFTIIGTLSTYGFVVFGVLGLSWIVARKKYFLMLLISITIVTALWFFINDLESNMIIKRFLNPLNDMSGQTRIIGTIYSFIDQNIFNLLFGFGWGNAELNGFQGSGIHYLLYNIGILGAVLFIFSFYLIIKNTKYRYLTILVLLLSLLNNSSVLTSFFNWAMLGFIFRLKNIQGQTHV